jgi:uncharacterized membrane protein YccC
MVQTDVSQLSSEAAEWHQILRNYREEFQECKKALQEMCKQSLTKDQLQEVEHFGNQFHIQLINIHDLKHNIKGHERAVRHAADNASESTYSHHEELLDQFLTLENTLQELRTDFHKFISATSCQ